jgi:hypothetical protein
MDDVLAKEFQHRSVKIKLYDFHFSFLPGTGGVGVSGFGFSDRIQ